MRETAMNGGNFCNCWKASKDREMAEVSDIVERNFGAFKTPRNFAIPILFKFSEKSLHKINHPFYLRKFSRESKILSRDYYENEQAEEGGK